MTGLKDAKWWREYRERNKEKLRTYERDRKRAMRAAKVVDKSEVENVNPLIGDKS